MAVYTVIGVWKDDQPYPVGTVAGDVEVIGGFHPDTMIEFEQGVWAVAVEADSDSDAEDMAIEEMNDAQTD